MEDSIPEPEEGLFRHRGEKSCGGELNIMRWSPTMDLLAAAFSDDSVKLMHSHKIKYILFLTYICTLGSAGNSV